MGHTFRGARPSQAVESRTSLCRICLKVRILPSIAASFACARACTSPLLPVGSTCKESSSRISRSENPSAFARRTNEVEASHGILRILPIPRGPPWWWREESLPLIETHRLNTNPSTTGQLTDGKALAHACAPFSRWLGYTLYYPPESREECCVPRELVLLGTTQPRYAQSAFTNSSC